MRLASALAIKLALTAVVVGLLLVGVLRTAADTALVAVLVIWAVSFVVGDLAILPAAGAALAAVADVVLAALILKTLLVMSFRWSVLGVSAAVGLAEYFYHRYLVASGAVRRRSGVGRGDGQ